MKNKPPVGAHVLKRSSIVILVLLGLAAATQAQRAQPIARKFDEFTAGIGSPEYRFGNYDQQQKQVRDRLALYAKELRRAGARPYAITYSPRVVRREFYDRSIAEMRAGALWELASAPFDWRDINIVNGGYREVATTELWIVPTGAQPPCPTPSVKPADVAHCPDVRIVGDLYVPNPEGPLDFTAQVSVHSTGVKPIFAWEVSGGEIVTGQGSDHIAVKVPRGSQGEVKVRVRLGGFSLECPLEQSSAAYRTTFGYEHYLVEEFEDINCEDEKARLDWLAVMLEADPNLQVHIVIYGGRSGFRNEALARAERMKDYLTSSRGTEADRILTLDGGYRNELSAEWWLSARGTGAPAKRPTVDNKFVKLKGFISASRLRCSV
jgi:hypothetical protein